VTNASFNPILRPQFLEASTPPPNTRHVLYLGTARPRSLVPARPATCSPRRTRSMSCSTQPNHHIIELYWSPPRSMFVARGGSQVRPLVFLSRTDRASDRFGTSDRKVVTNTSQPVQTVAAFEMRPHRHFPLYLFAPLVTTVHRYRAAVRQSKTLGSNLNLTI
jgi:hypothetical protein